jgi:hypothetical protein
MPPPPDSALRFRPLAVLRSLVAIGIGYGLHYGVTWAAILLAWGGRVALNSAILVPLAVLLMLAGLVSGGALAGRIAGRGPGGHGLLVGAIALVVLIVGLFTIDSVEPWWFRVVGAVVAMPMAFLGAELAGYKRPSPGP